MSFTLYYHPDIKTEDLPPIPRNIQKRISTAIEKRLKVDPERYGEPLRSGLQGYRKLRVGDYRIIYKVEGQNILIFKIGHRKEAYDKLPPRINISKPGV